MALTHLVLLFLAQGPVDAAPPPPTLAEVLERVGKAEAHQTSAPPGCVFVETIRVEELDGEGRVWGWAQHLDEVTHQRGDFSVKPLETLRGGHEMDGRLKPKRFEELNDEDKRKRRNFRTAFHRDEQPLYRYEMRGRRFPDKPAWIVVWFEPREPHAERFKGTAIIDTLAMRIVSIDQQLSWKPVFLWEFDMHLDLEHNACGDQVTRVAIKGSGGFLFIRKFFRSLVARRDYRPLSTDAGTP